LIRATEPSLDAAIARGVAEIGSSPRYQYVLAGFIARLLKQQLLGILPSYSRHHSGQPGSPPATVPERAYRQAVAATRAALHQAVGAYLPPAVESMSEAIREAHLADSADARAFAARLLAAHPSTRDRVPALADWYSRLGSLVGSASSILDLACGLHPLESPWMPLAPATRFVALDVDRRLVTLVDAWLTAVGIEHESRLADVAVDLPEGRFDIAYALKLLPTLERQGDGLAAALLRRVDARWIIVSYPTASLSGRDRGMARNYRDQFERLIAGEAWRVVEIELLPGELVFVVDREPQS